jgi:hypothetical protein
MLKYPPVYYWRLYLLNTIKEYLVRALTRVNFFKAKAYLKSLGYENVVQDLEDRSIAFTFADERVAMLNMDHDMLGYSIEATVVFSADTLSLKTVSDLSNITYTLRCSSSGIRPAGDNRVRLNVSYHMGHELSKYGISTGMLYLNRCLSAFELYLSDCLKKLDRDSYDLSMFEDIDITAFNPQLMGELKEFVHGSWAAYEDAVESDYSSFTNHPYALDLLTKIEACKTFEEVNGLQVSEVGNEILDNIILGRQVKEVSRNTYGIN